MDATTDFIKQSYNRDAVNRVNAVVSTSLMTADTLEFSPVDTWNHPKIPRIEELELEASKNSSNRQWFDVKQQVNQTYASLTGVDVLNLVDKAKANFTIPYQYLTFDCKLHPSTNASNSKPTNDYLIEQWQAKKLLGAGIELNSTSWTSFMKRGFFIWGINSDQVAEKLLYGSQFYSGSLFLFECSTNSVAVEANIICSSDTCETKRMRRLSPPGPKTGLGSSYDATHRYYTFDRLIRHLPEIGGDYQVLLKPNPVDLYVYGAAPWGLEENGMPTRCNWTEYIGEPHKSIDMSHRLTRFLNTYWDASRWPLAVTRNDPYGKSSMNATSGEAFATMTMNKTDAIITRTVPVYKANKRWVAVLVVCSSVLFLLGLTSFILSFSVAAPDIFDYVSSLTRDNPHIHIPSGGSGLDGADRARLLRRLPIQFGDVHPTSEAGYIALKSSNGEMDLQRSRIRKDRLYN